ncbi:glycosyltransferase involved in cell wall biosynthesis [Salinibacter ruber]|uniref:glycosyltransferase family 4 protein n=1 Tax=Salinibacter ruber TaxID=146919 RepID=UPI0021696C8C|nr:glycosyltransferase family 4 protein [Salinibacter ruber]MCS4160059.1 glycosyltransferase involved in cell wall biosynthesis [Salinibacter ruber]
MENAAEKGGRVLIVEGHPKYFVSHRLPWARAAREAGYEIHVTALKTGDGDLVREEGFRYHGLAGQNRGKNPGVELRFLYRLYRLLRALEPDLVHFITLRSVLYGALPARLAGVPAVLNSVTGLGFLFTDEAWSVRILRWAVVRFLSYVLRRSDQVTTFQNPDDAGLFVSRGVVPEEKTVVTPGSGVDPERFVYSGEPARENGKVPIVMLPTRLLWEKGVEEFVEAARKLQTNGVQARFAMVGDTDPENPGAVPKAQIDAWADDGSVEWWGRQAPDEMPDILQKASVVCLPSYREGVPKVLIEAASCGRPIVTTDVPGCREIVNHEDTGFLVNPRDAEGLARRIQDLLEDPDLRREMGRNGRSRVENNFTAAQVAETIVDCYDRLLAQNP